MTLAEVLLEKIADWHPEVPGRHTLVVTGPNANWEASVTVDQRDELSSLVWEVARRRLNASMGPRRSLPERAEQVAHCVTSFLDGLCVVEVDLARGEAMLRSKAPTCRGETVSYTEVMLSSDFAICRRFEAPVQPSSRRQQVPFALTHEALVKLADDLAGD